MNRDVATTAVPPAFLVVRTGSEKGIIHSLYANQRVSIGRSKSNRIVIEDDLCSRNHCDLFFENNRWQLKDLESRNGTKIDDRFVTGTVDLQQGQSIEIGGTLFGFTLDPKLPFRDHLDGGSIESETSPGRIAKSNIELPSEILRRRQRSTYETLSEDEARREADRTKRDLIALFQLGNSLAAAGGAHSVAEQVLDCLIRGTTAEIGAVLLWPPGMVIESTSPWQSADLQITAYRNPLNESYRRVSDSLSRYVLHQKEAVLASDVNSDHRFVDARGSMSELSAQSLICAPIRTADHTFGLLHLYSTKIGLPLDDDDLNFTLAIADVLANALLKLSEVEQLQGEIAKKETEKRELLQRLQPVTRLIGSSPSIERLRSHIDRIAKTDAVVLIRGESGVGKELVARAIHQNSRRHSGPFLTMNCAALAESLLESELFGHERGAFTGAVARKQGKFEQADGGTLFLDEVGEMTPGVQAKFLRVLEGHPFERVGGSGAISVNVRVVAATNRDLEKSVRAGEFRKDLYFRLQVLEANIDPLRERRSDVPLLAKFFLEQLAKKLDRPVASFSPEALAAMTAYDWPGNVRELQHTTERAVILCTGPQIEPHDLQLSALGDPTQEAPSPGEDLSNGRPDRQAFTGGRQVRSAAGNFDSSETFSPPRRATPKSEVRLVPLETIEIEHMVAVLESLGWNKSQAAQVLGIERSTLDRKLKKHDLDRRRTDSSNSADADADTPQISQGH